MAERPHAVAVTGAAGYVGSRLLQELEDQEGLAKVLAIDTKPLRRPVHNIQAQRLDVTHPLNDLFHDLHIDTVVHLAFAYPLGAGYREVEAARRANLAGLNNVLTACRQARVSNFIYLSSHSVYGPHSGNPVPITEEEPLRPPAALPYAQDKALGEEAIGQFVGATPQVEATILRCCVVLGPSQGNPAAGALRKRLLLGVWREDPPWQFVHEDDLAALLSLAVINPKPGIYNVAGSGVVPYSEVARNMGAKLVKLSPRMAYAAADLGWRLGVQREARSRALDFTRYPIVMSTGRLRKETGFRFRYSARDALTSYVSGVME